MNAEMDGVPELASTAAAESEFHDRATTVLEGRSQGSRLRRILPFLGPAFIASIAYVDPGNFATNIQAGAKYGYMLVWVIVASNLMAILIQTLSAKLGIATGRNLAEMCRERFPRRVVWGMWGVAELVAIATDIAEFIGAALGFNLIFGIPLFPAALLTAVTTFLILGLQRYGVRPLEAVISAMLGVIAVCYLIETVLEKPAWLDVGHAVVQPHFSGTESVLLAVGILGATVMPHVIFLHSALTQDRVRVREPRLQRKLFRFELIDCVIALTIAGMVNAAMLIMAASTFFNAGLSDIASIEDAHKTLEPLLGSGASLIFGISLLASGLSSSTVGTMAGQVIMQGFLRRHIPLWLRRGLTMLPSLFIIGVGLDPTDTLVVSQVILSFGIPFALVPLVMFTRNAGIMGTALVNRTTTTVVASAVATLIISLNLYLLWSTFFG